MENKWRSLFYFGNNCSDVANTNKIEFTYALTSILILPAYRKSSDAIDFEINCFGLT